MPIPEANLTVKDGALGIAAASANNVGAKVGCCSGGTANTVYAFSNPQTVRDTLGTGPLVEALCYQLAIAGGPQLAVKSPSSTAGAAAAPVATQTGTATLGTPAGAAYDAYSMIITIIDAGATLVAATATFKYSLDGGRTYSGTIAMPSSGVYAVPNTNLTLTWSYTSGTAFVAGDSWTVAVTGPASTLNEVMTAMDALIADTQEVFNYHVLGIPADLTAAAALFAALEAKLIAAASTYFKYGYGTMELPVGTDAANKAGMLSSAGVRTEVAAGYLNLTSAVNGSAYTRPAGWVSTARAAAVPPSEDLGRVATGPVAGIVALTRDEYKTPLLDAAGMTTLRTIVGLSGFFVTTGRLKVTVGSDFSLIQYRRVMDIASRTIRLGQLRYLNDSIVVDKTTGHITDGAANQINAYLEQRLRAALTSPGYASDVSVEVDKTTNILSTQTLVVRYRVVPLGYAKTINGEVGFSNPALKLV